MAKYSVGDWVSLKGPRGAEKHRFFILEVRESYCAGGKQVFYLGRDWVKLLSTTDMWDPTMKEFQIRESEIGEKVKM